MIHQHPFTWRHFEAEIILLCVRWYLKYASSYRDVEEMMMERGLTVDPHHHHDDLSLGPRLCPRARQAMPSTSQSLQRLVESR